MTLGCKGWHTIVLEMNSGAHNRKSAKRCQYCKKVTI